ncbi:GDSL-type esterase/lipase family protein [Massilia sp. B-10]|nr:GDSL-type esterase/lipase family protein [Massilia sp. B-10]
MRLSNLYGSLATDGGAGARGRACLSNGAIVPGSDLALLFGGQAHVTIAPGGSVVSDGASMAVAPLQELALSLFLPEPVAQPTIHGAALQTAYGAPGEDLTAAVAFPTAELTRRRYFVSDLEVTGSASRRALAVVGDSISDGIGSTGGGNRRWTDALAERLQAMLRRRLRCRTRASLASNRLLRDGNEVYVGPSMLARFERDALDKPGVRWIILSAGINDISASELQPDAPAEQASAQEIIDGMKKLIRRAGKARAHLGRDPDSLRGHRRFLFGRRRPEAQGRQCLDPQCGRIRCRGRF